MLFIGDTCPRREEHEVAFGLLAEHEVAVRPPDGEVVADRESIADARREPAARHSAHADLEFVLGRRVRQRVRPRRAVVAQADVLAREEVDVGVGVEARPCQHRLRAVVALRDRRDLPREPRVPGVTEVRR